MNASLCLKAVVVTKREIGLMISKQCSSASDTHPCKNTHKPAHSVPITDPKTIMIPFNALRSANPEPMVVFLTVSPLRPQHVTPEGQEGGADDPPGEGWVQVPGAVVVSEKTEHIVNSHQVAENRREEEEVTHCGDVTNQVGALFTLTPLTDFGGGYSTDR